MNKKLADTENGHRPPVFKSWKTWYILVIGFLVLQIILYYLITLALA